MTLPRLFRPRLAFSEGRPAVRESAHARHQAEQFRLVMLPHLDAAHSYARYLTRDAHRAEDITQEAFLRALRHFDSWRGESARFWLLQIVRNCFLATLAEHDRARTDSAIDPGEDDGLIEHRNPETLAVAQDEAAMLRQTIADLPQPFREALILRELDELSYKEIAELTHVPIGTVMSRLARARALLAELLLSGHPSGTQVRR